jgi:DnaK suppressor protein
MEASMPTKKPSAKASKAKKTVSAKAPPAKKPAAKSASAKPAAAKVASKPPVKPAKAAKAAPPPKKPVAPAPKAAAKPAAKAADKPATGKSVVAVATAQRPVSSMPTQPKVVAIAEVRKKIAPVTVDGEEGEESSTNLLAGPRNVTPYQPKRGEQYMNKEQLDHFRHILSSWKRDLMEEVDRTVLHMKDEAANFPDPNDRATQESEFSLELRTRDRERKLIRKIDEAISRIDDGSYGYCVETGEEIGIKRLEARPVATLCVEAQERRERREKQYGDRDDRYR